jgi:hypothetical protein
VPDALPPAPLIIVIEPATPASLPPAFNDMFPPSSFAFDDVPAEMLTPVPPEAGEIPLLIETPP